MKNVSISFTAALVLSAVLSTTSQGQLPRGFAFSVDIGSDRELSDPSPDGLEGFDPGDAYRTDALAGSIAGASSGAGADGTHRDDEDLLGMDADPNAGTSPVTPVPVGSASPARYHDFFDLDGYDVINLQLTTLEEDGLSPPYLKTNLDAAYGAWGWLECIEEVVYLAVSFDDDDARGWTSPKPRRVPVESVSSSGKTYGSSTEKDEIVGINLVPGTSRPLELDLVFGIGSEKDVHPDLAPNPDIGDSTDDDVDALDMLYQTPCDVFLYSADREGAKNPAGGALKAAGIYQEGVTDPVIRPFFHLGVRDEADIDAFEMAWIPTNAGDLALGLLFSVDDDDPRTPSRDETGGLDPAAIYGSLLDGRNFELVSPVMEDHLYSVVERGVGNYDLLSIDSNNGLATVLTTISLVDGFVFALDLSPDGSLYAASTEYIARIDITPPYAVVKVPLSTRINTKGGAFKADGTLLLLDSNAGTSNLYQVDVASGAVTLVGGIAIVGDMNGIDFDPDGRLWGLGSLNDELCELDPASGGVLGTWPVSYPAGRDSDDFGMAIDETGRMFITNEYLLEITGYSTGAPVGDPKGPTGYSTLHCLASKAARWGDIDAIAASADDLYVPGLAQPIIYQRQ